MSANIPKTTVCLWYDHNAEDAANFYARTKFGGRSLARPRRLPEGLSWQITTRALIQAIAKGGEAAQRVFAAMMTMKKIDVAAIEAAVHADA